MKQHHGNRKIFFLVITAVLLLALSAGSALAEQGVLKLPSGLKTLEEEAFMGDTSLQEVLLPEGLTAIGDRAFADSSLQRVYLPESLTDIGTDAFPAGTVGYGPAGTAAAEYFANTAGLTFETPDFTFEIIDGRHLPRHRLHRPGGGR